MTKRRRMSFSTLETVGPVRRNLSRTPPRTHYSLRRALTRGDKGVREQHYLTCVNRNIVCLQREWSIYVNLGTKKKFKRVTL